MRIISRDAWEADPPAGRLLPVNWPRGVDLWVHRSGGATSTNPGRSAGMVKAIQAFHTGPERGWSDIGYAFLVDSAGRVFEGRGRHLGAHSPGRNHEPSVCCLGTFDDEDPPLPMRRAVFELMTWLEAGDLRGHRENTATSCPGDRIMAQIVNADPAPAGPPRTLRERLIDSGYGPLSADVILERMRLGQFGTVPRPHDRELIVRLRTRGGLGLASARAVVKAGRFRP